MASAKREHYHEYTNMELAAIEGELKDWFISRRVDMERNLAIKKKLDAANVTGKL